LLLRCSFFSRDLFSFLSWENVLFYVICHLKIKPM
jgi:hypothetical protein